MNDIIAALRSYDAIATNVDDVEAAARRVDAAINAGALNDDPEYNAASRRFDVALETLMTRVREAIIETLDM